MIFIFNFVSFYRERNDLTVYEILKIMTYNHYNFILSREQDGHPTTHSNDPDGIVSWCLTHLICCL